MERVTYCKLIHKFITFCHITWDQLTVTFPIGDHVNVLHDYKKTGPSKILKLLACRCQHLIDMLVEFCQNHIFLNLFKWLSMPYPSMFTNFCMNYYAPMPCGKKLPKILPPLKSFKNPHLHCQQVLPANITMSLLKGTYVR